MANLTRTLRAQIAEDTVKIVRSGFYLTNSGTTVHIENLVQYCVQNTQLFEPTQLEQLRKNIAFNPSAKTDTKFAVVNETTLAGAARVLQTTGEPVLALNFASARNPGGGFLNGSQAQEESLAVSSALYESLLQKIAFYRKHRNSASLLYSDTMILSPDCPVFRDDSGSLLDAPYLVSFITSPAPNAGAIRAKGSAEAVLIPKVLAQRLDYILTLAATYGYKNLVLGAWGCGVFGNDPRLLAETYSALLITGVWSNYFNSITLSIKDNSPQCKKIKIFADALTQL
ncbi:hypothetical protein TI04_03140 [Achromatium sp. WMS2]|nr:hypothetical protein TI04_03140 [Achromatium sp. WMS2]